MIARIGRRDGNRSGHKYSQPRRYRSFSASHGSSPPHLCMLSPATQTRMLKRSLPARVLPAAPVKPALLKKGKVRADKEAERILQSLTDLKKVGFTSK
ncbi:hypothetical protein CHLRE_06g284726v5 [Chlamydomonas reinhardtii]|uniref:Uncharacterized protein n=1 Tax=Chlamydomonas reinhardtii TaxID=3055 RepID=A0A2K3DQ12_CHLRE|nr:uncharacterized protein CHLRE_06g284726v5 [Chlamydomonas reinhardtii]PNW82578.1 hypothetical protein CHLRE_06g284726v5 [Chlamydomonas reinhardtii]